MVAIYVEDSEEVRESKRRENEIEMRKYYQQKAEQLPLGLPLNCKVEQVEYKEEPTYTGIRGGYPIGGKFRIWKVPEYGPIQYIRWTDSTVRMRIYDGYDKGSFRRVFAGNSHSSFEAGLKKDRVSHFFSNFDSKKQSLRAKRPRWRKIAISPLGEEKKKLLSEAKGEAKEGGILK